MPSGKPDSANTEPAPTAMAARVAVTLLAVALSVGRALAHAGHGGGSPEPVPWLAYGPVFVGAVTVATAVGLGRDGVVTTRRALGLGALGLALVAVGVARLLR